MEHRSSASPPVVRNDYEELLHQHWQEKQDDPINLLLGKTDSLYHHHFGIGEFDRRILRTPPEEREQRVLEEMHRMENDQVSIILTGLGAVSATARLLDAGSGRGGTAFAIHDAFGCDVDGVNFCTHHVAFARELAQQRGASGAVRFHYANMVATPFPDAAFQYVVSNETTMYVDLFEAFAEFARVLEPGGRYVLTTWCANDAVPLSASGIAGINEHYVCRIHHRSTYFRALAASGLAPSRVIDLTQDAIPYWELRTHCHLRTGVEPLFLQAHRDKTLNYLTITAERVHTPGDSHD
ncbi:SAM-dependent methyltransferase [Streptomyces sp. NPDC127068]|uniref:SAM-dependent methyltransferase n=1 Tax=Streptomyces sp. NPDC127068 TaxID=3347127 RepID=UPI003654DC57